MTSPLLPYLRLNAGENLANVKRVHVSTGVLQDLILLSSEEMLGGLVFDVDGFKLESGTLPDRINWQVFGGRHCNIEDEPLLEGTTFLTGNLGAERNGPLWEVRHLALTFLVRGYCASDTGATGKVSFRPTFVVIPPFTTGPRVVAGTAVG